MHNALHNNYSPGYVMALNVDVNRFANPSSTCTSNHNTPDDCAATYYALQHSDIFEDEAGPTGGCYVNGVACPDSVAQYKAMLDWSKASQIDNGKDFLIGAIFADANPPSTPDKRFAFASYLVARHGHTALDWVGNSGWNGKFNYNYTTPSEFAARTGTDCVYTGYPYFQGVSDTHLFYRIMHDAVAIVNNDSVSHTVSLQTYTFNQAGNGGNDYLSYYDIETGNQEGSDNITIGAYGGEVWMAGGQTGGTDLGCPAQPGTLP